jgi:hypothetical protein
LIETSTDGQNKQHFYYHRSVCAGGVIPILDIFLLEGRDVKNPVGRFICAKVEIDQLICYFSMRDVIFEIETGAPIAMSFHLRSLGYSFTLFENLAYLQRFDARHKLAIFIFESTYSRELHLFVNPGAATTR